MRDEERKEAEFFGLLIGHRLRDIREAKNLEPRQNSKGDRFGEAPPLLASKTVIASRAWKPCKSGLALGVLRSIKSSTKEEPPPELGEDLPSRFG